MLIIMHGPYVSLSDALSGVQAERSAMESEVEAELAAEAAAMEAEAEKAREAIRQKEAELQQLEDKRKHEVHSDMSSYEL